MRAEQPTDRVLRKIFCEVTQGYSVGTFDGKDVIIKHLAQEDQYLLENHKEGIYEAAKKRGLPTEKEALQTLIDGDVWSVEEENSIEENAAYLKNLEDTKRNLIIPSQIENINKDIDEATIKLNGLRGKRQSMLTQTCEGYSTKKNNDYSVYLCLYKDRDCKERFMDYEDFGALSKAELNVLFESYATAAQDISLDNIKFLAISHVFTIYYNLLGIKNLHAFFDKPIYELTFYQLNLLNYARVLNSILENVENIPEEIKKNPDDLIAYADSKRKTKDMAQKSQDKDGFSVMGATKKDMDEMGVSDQTSVSPFELAQKKGSLTLEDFQNFS